MYHFQLLCCCLMNSICKFPAKSVPSILTSVRLSRWDMLGLGRLSLQSRIRSQDPSK
jgi:hypothetical protein